MSNFTIVLIAWGMSPIVPALIWAVPYIIMTRPLTKLALARDYIIAAIMSPILLLVSALLACWKVIEMHISRVADEEPTSEETSWRSVWNRNAAGFQMMLKVSAISTFFLALMTLFASMPSLPGVDACTDIDGFSKCSVGPLTFVTVNGLDYYLNTTSVFSAQLGNGNTGNQATWFREDNLTGIINCQGTLPNPGNLVLLTSYVLDSGATVSVGGNVCPGAGIGFPLPFGPILSAVAVYCPIEDYGVQVDATASSLYGDFSKGKVVNEFDATVSQWPQLCLAGGSCMSFPLASNGVDYDLLFISPTGISPVSAGAWAAVKAPMPQTARTYTVRCESSRCWQKPVEDGDCPAVHQALALNASDLYAGIGVFNSVPGVITEIGTQFKADASGTWASLFLDCVNSATSDSSLYALPAYLSTLYNTGSQEQLVEECQSGGKVELQACFGQQTSNALSGQRSPVPTDDGKVVFTCLSTNRLPAVWYNVKSQPIPVENVTHCNSSSLGIAECKVCGNFSVCYPPGKQPPNITVLEQQMTVGNSSVGNYVPGANYCRLKVLSATSVHITVQPLNPPCLTSGEMAQGTLTAVTTWEVNVDGWTTQADGSGFLFWKFKGTPKAPKKRRTSTTVTVSPSPADCIDQDCKCNGWDCNHDPVCMIAESLNVGTCKCAFIGGNHPVATFLCKSWAVICYLLFWGPIAFMFIILLRAVYNKYNETYSKT